MRERKKANPKKFKTKAWYSTWNDGELGWMGPSCLTDRRTSTPQSRNPSVDDEDEYFLCEVVVKPIRDKKGRLIKRKAKTLGVSRAKDTGDYW